MPKSAGKTKIVEVAGQLIDLSNFPYVAQLVSEMESPRPTPIDVHAWAMQEKMARDKIEVLVARAKRTGKEKKDLSPRALADIATSTGLDKNSMETIVAETWAGGQGGSFDFSCITPYEFFARLRHDPGAAPLLTA